MNRLTVIGMACFYLWLATPAAQADSYDQLLDFTARTGSRQPGQPGNVAADRLIAARFKQAVAQGNRDLQDQWTQAQALLAKADSAQADVLGAKEQLEQNTSSGLSKDSPWYVKCTVERPTVSVVFLLAMGGVFAAAWLIQRRKALLVATGICTASAILLPLAALLITTEAEGISQQAASGEPANHVQRTSKVLSERIDQAARQALLDDRQAAEVLPGLWQYGRIQYPAAVFVPGNAQLIVDNRRVPLYQMAPNLIEPANIPQGRFEGRLIYGAKGEPQNLLPIDAKLEGSSVLLDFDCGRNWLMPIRRKAELIIFIEPAKNAASLLRQAGQKVSDSPLSIPRFYLKREDLQRLWGDKWQKDLGSGTAITIEQPTPGRWQREMQSAHWLLIPSATPLAKPGTDMIKDPARQLVHLQTFLDSNSIVPSLSPGAGGAGNLVILFDLLEQFSQRLPLRPVLISVVNSHTNALQGEDEFAYAAFADAQSLREQLEWIEQQLARERFIAETFHRELDADWLESLRTAVVKVAGKKFRIKQPIQDRLVIRRNRVGGRRSTLITARNRLKKQLGVRNPTAQQVQQFDRIDTQLQQINQEADHLIKLMQLFNRFGLKTYYDNPHQPDNNISDHQKQMLVSLLKQLKEKAQRDRDHLIRLRDQLLGNLVLRRRLRYLNRQDQSPASDSDYDQLFAMQYPPLGATIALCLDLNFNTENVGFFFANYLSHGDIAFAEDRTRRLGRYGVRMARHFAAAAGLDNLLTDTITKNKGLPWQAHLGGKFVMASSTLNDHAVCALTLTSVQDHRPFVFTPLDTPSRIGRKRFKKVTRFVSGYLQALIDSQDLARQPIRVRKPEPFALDLSVRLQDRYSTDLPKNTVTNALVVAPFWLTNDLPEDFAMFGQVRPHKILITDQRGATILRGPRHRNGNHLAFGYNHDFTRLTQAVDMGAGLGQFDPTIQIRQYKGFADNKIIMSRFDKVDLLGLTVALTMAPADGIGIIDAKQDSLPKHYAIVGLGRTTKTAVIPGVPLARDGSGCAFIEPGTFFKLRIRSAIAINVDEQDKSSEKFKGVGFPANIKIIHDVVKTSYDDMTQLTEHRIKALSDRGVVDSMVERLVGDAQMAVQQRQGDAISPLEQGYGIAFRAYTHGLSIVADLITAVVVFMALIIPFCFFTMKLITPFTDANRQIALFGAIFVAMVLLLYFVHPAFAIADMPMVVILAFIILGLATFVAMILIGRFNSSMNQLVEQVLQSESADAPQGRLAEAAFLVGVNNMKRRRIRTTLTCTTIVLVTFTMLSVISVGQDVDPAVIKQDNISPYDGFVFTRSGLNKIPPLQVDRLRARFGADATVVARSWGVRKDNMGVYLPFELTPQVAPHDSARAPALYPTVLLGMQVAEDGFIQPMPLKAGRWFTGNDAREIILSVDAAELLGITPADFAPQNMHLLGMTLKLVGLLEDESMRQLNDLGKTPVLPLKFDPGPLQDRLRQDTEAALREQSGAGGLDSAGSAADLPGTSVVEPRNIAFVPLEIAGDLTSANFRTLSVKWSPDPPVQGDVSDTSSAQLAWSAANHMIQFQHVRLAVGLTRPVQRLGGSSQIMAGQYALTSSTSTQVGGILKAAIPIILAATIILNTMLGSVMERKREVAIYNAIGLNPGHVMVFFLAESLVFGLVGSVAGYLIGQVLSIVITRFDLVNLNLNYSSLAVIVVIFLTISTVLLSTIYPAMMAARAAVPSGQRRWSLPKPQGDEITVDFPFSYDARRVLGVCAYLYDFMEQNSETSTGKFLARNARIGTVPVQRRDTHPTAGGDKAYAMLFDIAPAPFDLGVNQIIEVYAAYNPKVKAHMLTVHLTRISGAMDNWVTVNQPFLEALRKRLLAWRSQSPDMQKSYYDKGAQLFAVAAELPVVADPKLTETTA